MKELCSCVVCCIQVADTGDRIDYEKLKKQEQIFFYDEVILYEDELADNGTAMFSVKIVSWSSCSVRVSVTKCCNSECVVTLKWKVCSVVACDGQWVLCPVSFLPESGRGTGEDEWDSLLSLSEYLCVPTVRSCAAGINKCALQPLGWYRPHSPGVHKQRGKNGRITGMSHNVRIVNTM